MAQECGNNSNAAIKLVKNIPVGAGLGGGSSDASATIILLNEMWNAGLSQNKLAEIGLKLGADLPIFLNRHAAFVSGIGDKVNNIKNLPELYAILVYPNKLIATKDIFRALNLSNKRKLFISKLRYLIEFSCAYLGIMTWLSFTKNQRNDLGNTAISSYPEIANLLQELSGLKGCEFARMSGSGSTCFAVFTNKSQAEIAMQEMEQKNPSFWIKCTKIVQKY
jgi:4-diphosphocytidyl-2-C-methyl-D-erythritol kinase